METEVELKELSDEALLQRLVGAAGVLSYYNAAEGPQYGKEREPRERAQSNFAMVKREVENRNLEYSLRGYLV